MDIQTGDLPCPPQFVQSDDTRREPLPDGRVRVTRDVWFYDRTGAKEWTGDTWIEDGVEPLDLTSDLGVEP